VFVCLFDLVLMGKNFGLAKFPFPRLFDQVWNWSFLLVSVQYPVQSAPLTLQIFYGGCPNSLLSHGRTLSGQLAWWFFRYFTRPNISCMCFILKICNFVNPGRYPSVLFVFNVVLCSESLFEGLNFAKEEEYFWNLIFIIVVIFFYFFWMDCICILDY